MIFPPRSPLNAESWRPLATVTIMEHWGEKAEKERAHKKKKKSCLVSEQLEIGNSCTADSVKTAVWGYYKRKFFSYNQKYLRVLKG